MIQRGSSVPESELSSMYYIVSHHMIHCLFQQIRGKFIFQSCCKPFSKEPTLIQKDINFVVSTFKEVFDFAHI